MSKEKDHEEFFTFSKTGVKFRRGADPSFDEWFKTVMQYANVTKGVQWWLGDLLNFGEAKYGDLYDQHIQETGLDYQTLANYKWVSNSVAHENRHAKLSWQHHVPVAKFKPAEQERWLKKAEKEELSSADLKKAIATSKKRHDARDAAQDVDVKDGRYRVLLADPDWKTLGLGSLELLKLPADANAVLFLWTPVDKLYDAMVLMDRWGFGYKDVAVWDRCKSDDGGWFRNQHDHLLVGVKGNIHSPAPELLSPSIVRAKAGKTARPEEFYRIVEDMLPIKSKKVVRVDLFGHEERAGWDCNFFGIGEAGEEGRAEEVPAEEQAAA